jgi:hypothetical protein
MRKVWIETRSCECWPCALADARRTVVEARSLAGTVEMALAFVE